MPKLSIRKRIAWSVGVFAALLGLAVLQVSSGVSRADDLTQSGTIEIHQTQVAFIFSTNVGGGTLHYGGESYKFSIGGLGVGGYGISQLDATGEVYNLTDLRDFAGAYGSARTGITIGESSTGDLWLENPAGVYIHIKAKRQGLALSLGADAIYIKFE